MKKSIFIFLFFIISLLINHTIYSKNNSNKIINSAIDTSLKFSTYFGSDGDDNIRQVIVDKNNDIIVTGTTRSNGLATNNSYQYNKKNGWDVFVAKFSPEGELIWCTYLGGNGDEVAFGLDISSKNEIWICGHSTSSDFPLSANAIQPYFQGGPYDSFISAFNENGKLLYSTLFGSSDYEAFANIKLDSEDNIWVWGQTSGNDYPVTKGAIKTEFFGSYIGILTKFDKNMNLKYSTLFGGDWSTYGHNCYVDNQDNIIVIGITNDSNFPVTESAFQKEYKANWDSFIAKFDKNGKLIWSSFFGGSDNDAANDIIIDDDNNIYISGYTKSNDFPIKGNVFQKKLAGSLDEFISKFDSNGKLIWSTYFGGSKNEGIFDYLLNNGGLYLDKRNNNVLFASRTISTDIPVSDDAAFKNLNGSYDEDAYLCVIDNNAEKILYCTYIGGSDAEYNYDIVFDNESNLIIGGITRSSNYPVTDDAYQKKHGGSNDGYISKFYSYQKDTCSDESFAYNNFENTDNLKLLGSAKILGKDIRMTLRGTNQAAAIWYKIPITISNGFSTTFRFRFSQGYDGLFSDGSLPGADGIAFVIQNYSTDIIGSGGLGIGYSGIPNSIAIEFDTFKNDELTSGKPDDPNGNHISIQSNGIKPNSSSHNGSANIAMLVDAPLMTIDSTVYYAKIDYHVQSGCIRVFLDKTGQFKNPVLVKRVLIEKLLDLKENRKAYIGITAATGHSWENHDILSWNFCAFNPGIANSIGEELIQNTSNSTILCFPNPFNYNTSIEINIPKYSNVNLSIYNSLGQKIDELVNTSLEQGNYKYDWQPKQINTGIYYAKLIINNTVYCQKIIYLE